MPKPKSNVRLFESDGYSFKLWLYPPDAEEMRANGEIEMAYHPVTGTQIGYKLRDCHKAATRQDDGAISVTEMKVNIGEPTKALDGEMNKYYVNAVQEKVREWPGAWDRKSAPTVNYA
jgi:hypothetical protein